MAGNAKRGYAALFMAVLLAVLPAVASAADGMPGKNAGDWMVRFRGIGFAPDESGTANDGTTAIGGSAAVNTTAIPELDFTYFFTKNIAAELILATTRHTIDVKDSTLGDVNVGRVSLLPPVLTLQYHFNPMGKFSPYVGAGINYTIFYNPSKGRGGGGVGITNATYTNSIG
jgi:outer membrane protein